MITLIILIVIAAFIAGLGIRFLAPKFNPTSTQKRVDSWYYSHGYATLSRTYEITKKELTVGTLIISLILAPVIVFAGWNIAKANKLSYNEYWNGYETKANWLIQPCTRDGSCAYHYSCDPYLVARTRTVTDSEGNTRTETYFETEYHQCPYVTEEWIFNIETTLGKYHIAHNIPENPVEWRAGSGFGSGTKGIPPFWQAAYDRISAGAPGPVTKRMTYDNYILASDTTILRSYSDQIEAFEDAGLLPKLSNSVHTFYNADKVYFVDFEPPYKNDWIANVSYLNAALGTELQGDLHLVLTNSPVIEKSKDQYITALKAYWSNAEVFGDDALSKNTIIVVLGTDGSTVTWARAVTGMPLGNEYMLTQIQNSLPGQGFAAANIVGRVNGEFYTREDGKEKVRARFEHAGILARILWGLDDPKSRFVRVSMTDNNEEDSGSGFLYLAEEIEPDGTTKTIIFIVTLLLSLGVWWVFAYNKFKELE